MTRVRGRVVCHAAGSRSAAGRFEEGDREWCCCGDRSREGGKGAVEWERERALDRGEMPPPLRDATPQ